MGGEKLIALFYKSSTLIHTVKQIQTHILHPWHPSVLLLSSKRPPASGFQTNVRVYVFLIYMKFEILTIGTRAIFHLKCDRVQCG
jgi:hypothetical protein